MVDFKVIRTAFLFLIITNSSFWIANIWLSAARPIFVIDYLLIVPIFIVNNKYIRVTSIILIFFLIFSLDIILWVRQYFPFMRVGDAIFLLKLLRQGPIIYVYMLFLAIVVFLTELFLIISLFRKEERKSVFLVCCILIVVMSGLVQTNQYLLKNSPESVYEVKGVARSYFVYLYKLKDSLLYGSLYWTPKVEPAIYEGASESLWRQVENGQAPSKILFIINESWGKTFDQELEQEVLKSIIYQRDRMDRFEIGEIPFVGATVDGELRELCQLKVSSFNLRALGNTFNTCLPNKLIKQNYKTFGLHGANSIIYDRMNWYPRIGLQNTIFFENLTHPSLCYSFSGACDNKLFSHVKTTFSENKDNKVFYYWLTLNTHYPYDLRDLNKKRFNCLNHDIPVDTEECRNLTLQTQYFDNLAKLIGLDYFKGVEVIVVGDHAPPIFKPMVNKNIFKENTVSFIRLKMK